MGQELADLFIGREYELSQLTELLSEPKPKIAVIYGRRRVGKTRLIAEALKDRKSYRFEGLEGKATAKQKAHFATLMADQFNNSALAYLRSGSWQEIFKALSKELPPFSTICMDEFQWIASNRTDLVSSLKFAWDNYFSKIPGLKLIICGSISSFLVKKVLRSKALYGRVSLAINLKQLPLAKLLAFFPNVHRPQELLDFYLAVGGIPEYWNQYNPSKSTATNLNDLAFHETAYFVSEFDRIFTSHFGRKRIYADVVAALSNRLGLTRQELAEACGINPNGNFSAILEDLELAGFIASSGPFDKSHESSLKKYYLSDFYLRFYFTFINSNRARILKAETPLHINSISSEGARSVWRGLAFELFCQREADRIAQILGFSAVKYTYGPYLKRNDTKSGIQIDLLFQRIDKVLVLCEAKYQQAPIGFEVIEEIQQKIDKANFSPKMTVEKVLISVGPVSKELQQYRYFSRIITLDNLLQN